MKIIPTLRAPAVVRPAVSFSFVFCPILLALLAGRGLAQTSLPGYTPAAPKLMQNLSHEEKARRGAAPLSRIHPEIKIESARAHRLPALTPSEMRPERRSMRLRVGAVRRLDRPLAAQNDATFIQTPEGKLYVMRVTSEGAAMTRLHFSGVALPAGARLFVYSRTNPDAYHALHIPGEDGLDVTGRSEFWTPPIAGAEVVVEYIAPATTPDEPPAQPPFVIDLVSHIFLDPRAARSSVGSQQNSPGLCNENVPAEWGEAAKSVGLFQFTTPKGEFACSGILLNNARNDGTPYFLTANHCLSRNDYSTSLRVYWLYDSGDSPTSQTPQSSGGAVIATGVAGDFTLLQLPYAPPGVRFAGWTAESPAASTPVTSIHHPQASYKRFSSGQTVAGACPSGLQGGCEQYLPVRWQSGITEPGSSGAPLFVGSSSDPRVAGLLSGGLSSCSNRTGLDFYSRFDLAFTAIAPYLTGQGCAFTLQPVKRPPGANDPQTREIFSATGGDGSVNLKVRTGTDCSWTAQSEAPWITLTSPASGSGEVTITYTVAPHTDTQPRSGYLLIAGHRLLVTQMGVSNCAASAASLGQSFNGALSGANCRSALDQRAYADHYTFTGQAGQQLILEMYSSFFDTFLLLLGPDGKLVEYNDDISFASNSVIPGTGGHLELTASGDYTIEATSFGPAETGSYTLDIKRVCSLRFTQEPALIPAAGGNGRLNVTAPPACQWTAQSQVNWLTINSGAGDGNGAITFTAAPNPDVGSDNTARPREGPLAIMTNSGSLTTSVKQNYNCGFRVGPKSISIPPSTALSESSIFTGLGVSTGATCTWTATSNAPWLEFGQGGSIYTATGMQLVVYLKVNSLKFGDTPRTGSLTVAGETVNVTVQPIGQLCPIGNLNIGQTISDTLAPGCRRIAGATGYVKQYKFQGRAGQRIAVLSSSLETGLNLWLRRMDGDDGLFTASLTSQPSFILFSAGTLRMPDSGYITLPADGAYLVEVSSSPSEPVPGNGSFVLSVLEAPVGSCDFTVSTNGHNFTRDGGRGNLIVGANNGSCAWTAISTASWIKLMAPGGNGSGALEYSVEPNTGAFRTGAIVIAGRQLLVSQQPANALVAVSSADYTSNLANGAIQTIFGSGLAPQTIAAPTLPLPTTLGGAEVVVTTNSRASYNAPLFFVSPTQINFLMPYFLPGAVDITVKLNGQITGATRAVVGNLAPGLFTIDSSGRGLPAAYVLRARRDGTQTTEPIFNRDATGAIIPRPIRLADDENVFLILYGTGLNGVQLAGSEVEATFQDGITQKGQLFAAPGFSGLDQINLLLPLSLRGRGDVTLTIKRDGFVSNPVTIRIGGQ